MPKTVAIDDNVHDIILVKRIELRKKYNITLKISYMVNSILKRHVNDIEEILREQLNNVDDKQTGILQK